MKLKNFMKRILILKTLHTRYRKFKVKNKIKVLITGGAGFVGAHLTYKLISLGHKVLVVDILKSQGGIPFVNKNCNFIKGDISKLSTIKKIKKWKPNVIYHLAAQSAVEPAYDDPKFDIMTNTYGTFLLCSLAKELKVKKFIYTSSAAAIGSNSKKIINEKIRVNPDSLYGITKYNGEILVKQILGSTKTQTTIFRLFNTYGPGEDLNNLKKGMVSIYSSYVWKKKPIIVKGSLNRFRDFVYIKDCVNILSKCIEKTFKKKDELFHLTMGENLTVKELIKKILKASNSRTNYPVKISNNTPGDSFGFRSSNNKLKKQFNYTKKYNVDRGLKEYFKWIRKVPVRKNIKSYHPLKI